MPASQNSEQEKKTDEDGQEQTDFIFVFVFCVLSLRTQLSLLPLPSVHIKHKSWRIAWLHRLDPCRHTGNEHTGMGVVSYYSHI